MQNPLISIIIPVYGTEEYLPKCLDSVLSQSYKNLEIILINDGSPGNAVEIGNSYAKKDLRVKFINKGNTGLSNTRNLGIDKSHGDLIMFLDSDDFLESDCLLNMVREFSDDTDLVVASYKLCDSNNRNISLPEQSYGVYSDINDFLNDFYKYFATKSNFAWGKLYKYKIIKNFNIRFEPNIFLVEDLLFNIQYFKFIKQKINFIIEPGIVYRQHGNQTLSKRLHKDTFNWLEISFSKLFDFLLEHEKLHKTNFEQISNNLRANYAYFLQCYTLNDNSPITKKREYILKVLSDCKFSQYRLNSSKISFGRFQQFLLQRNLIYTYIFVTKLRYNKLF